MEINKVDISDELSRAYLDYAMDVIVDRALPDARDGLKPVHRRVLYAMHMLHLHYIQNGKKTATVKSARVVGEVIGKYHPHGDSAVYDTIVRMAQPFALRYPLVLGQGNFGSIDGDSAAAMRYTEVKLQKIADEILADLDKDTVDLKKNYDNTLDIPDYVLPTIIPNLLINGSSGIAVGLATNIPSHNLVECINASIALLHNPNITIRELMQHIPAPDFPTGGIIFGRGGIVSAYHTGKGRVIIRSRCEVETDSSGRNTIVVTEIPYNVNKAEMVEQISNLAAEKKIEGISSITDVSAKDIRILIELKKGVFPQVVLNNLYKLSSLQSTFSINMIAIVGGRPKTLTLKDALECFISHRREVVTRRTAYLLCQARDRAHILEALLVALDNMDEIVRIIRGSEDRASAKAALMGRAWVANVCADILLRFGNDCRPLYVPEAFGLRDGKYYLTETQTERILDMRLSQLVKIAKNEVISEYSDLHKAIHEYLEILGSITKLEEVIEQELIRVRDTYGDPRRTEIEEQEADITIEDLVAPDDVILTISKLGYAKYQRLSDYEAIHRGGRGRIAAKPKDDDFNEIMILTNTRDNLLIFTSKGRVFSSKVYRFPEASNGNNRGKPIVNIINIADDEKVKTILPINEFDDNHYVLFATRLGYLKKSVLSMFKNINIKGKQAINFVEGDELIDVAVTNGRDDVMIFTSKGMVMRFNESRSNSFARRQEQLARFKDDQDVVEETVEEVTDDNEVNNAGADEQDAVDLSDEAVRTTGPYARGVKGIKLVDDDYVVSLVVPKENGGTIFSISSNGMSRRTELDEFRISVNRGGMGVRIGPNNDETIVGALQVCEDDQIVLINNLGILIRVRVSEIRKTSRRAMGVRTVKLPENSYITALQRIPASIIPSDEDVTSLPSEDGEGQGENAENTQTADTDQSSKPEQTDPASEPKQE